MGLNLFVDIDNTIANTTETILNEIKNKYNIKEINTNFKRYDMLDAFPQHLSVSIRQTLKNLFSDIEIYKKIKPYYNSVNILRSVEKLFDNVNFCGYITSRENHLKDVTEKWLYINGFPEKEIIFSRDKTEIIEKDNVVIVEDNPNIIENLQKLGVITVIFSQTYNEHVSGIRINHWNDFFVNLEDILNMLLVCKKIKEQ